MDKSYERCTGKYFGFTYKCMNIADPQEIHYEDVIARLNNKGIVEDYVLEKDKKGRLHIHGVVQFDRTPLFSSLTKYGYAQKFEELYNTERWLKYIHKEEQDLDYFKTNYAF